MGAVKKLDTKVRKLKAKLRVRDLSEPMLKAKEVSERIGMTERFIRKARLSYGLPFYRIGGQIRFRWPEVEFWLQKRGEGEREC